MSDLMVWGGTAAELNGLGDEFKVGYARMVIGGQYFHLNKISIEYIDGFNIHCTWLGSGPAATELILKSWAMTGVQALQFMVNQLDLLGAKPE